MADIHKFGERHRDASKPQQEDSYEDPVEILTSAVEQRRLATDLPPSSENLQRLWEELNSKMIGENVDVNLD